MNLDLAGQAAVSVMAQAGGAVAHGNLLQRVLDFLSPYNGFIVILIVLWLFARRGRPRQGDFNRQAQDVLDEKYRKGEISRKTYEKFRQDISLRPKR